MRERSDTAAGQALYFGEWAEHRGGVRRRRVFGSGLGAPLAEIAGGNPGTAVVRALHEDGTANVTHVAATSGGGVPAFESPREYEAFGARRDATASAVERGFAGRPSEGASGLLRMGARHYDPSTGTFLQVDPLVLETQQAYAYASQNPYRFWDPTGLRLDTINTSSSWSSSAPSSYSALYPAASPIESGGQPASYEIYDPPLEPALLPWEIVGVGRAAVGIARGAFGIVGSAVVAAQVTRAAYVAEAQGIRSAAEKLMTNGVDPIAAARWAVDARNALKLEARESLPAVVRWGIEQRNIWKYGNPVGPSADALLATRTPAAVIESAGKTNRFLNWVLGEQ